MKYHNEIRTYLSLEKDAPVSRAVKLAGTILCRPVLGGLHHLAISVTREKWAALRANLDAAGVEYVEESGASLYFRDPDGARLELLADPLGEMYGSHVL